MTPPDLFPFRIPRLRFVVPARTAMVYVIE